MGTKLNIKGTLKFAKFSGNWGLKLFRGYGYQYG